MQARSFQLNLNGSLIERLYCCWILLRYPNAFVHGLMDSLAAALELRLAQDKHNATCPEAMENTHA